MLSFRNKKYQPNDSRRDSIADHPFLVTAHKGAFQSSESLESSDSEDDTISVSGVNAHRSAKTHTHHECSESLEHLYANSNRDKRAAKAQQLRNPRAESEAVAPGSAGANSSNHSEGEDSSLSCDSKDSDCVMSTLESPAPFQQLIDRRIRLENPRSVPDIKVSESNPNGDRFRKAEPGRSKKKESKVKNSNTYYSYCLKVEQPDFQVHFRADLLRLLRALVTSQDQLEKELQTFQPQGLEQILVKNWICENYFEKKNIGLFAELEEVLELPFERAMSKLVEEKLLLNCRQKRPTSALKSLLALLLAKVGEPKIASHFSHFPGTDRLSEKQISKLLAKEPLRSKILAELKDSEEISKFCYREFEKHFSQKIKRWIVKAISVYEEDDFTPGSNWKLNFRKKTRMRLVPIDFAPSIDKLSSLIPVSSEQ